MAENTTDAPVHVVGQPHQHPAVRRLARACLALVRWQRSQSPATGPVSRETPTSEADS